MRPVSRERSGIFSDGLGCLKERFVRPTGGERVYLGLEKETGDVDGLWWD